jgi:hypothetical protein
VEANDWTWFSGSKTPAQAGDEAVNTFVQGLFVQLHVNGVVVWCAGVADACLRVNACFSVAHLLQQNIAGPLATAKEGCEDAAGLPVEPNNNVLVALDAVVCRNQVSGNAYGQTVEVFGRIAFKNVSVAYYFQVVWIDCNFEHGIEVLCTPVLERTGLTNDGLIFVNVHKAEVMETYNRARFAGSKAPAQAGNQAINAFVQHVAVDHYVKCVAVRSAGIADDRFGIDGRFAATHQFQQDVASPFAAAEESGKNAAGLPREVDNNVLIALNAVVRRNKFARGTYRETVKVGS